MRKILTVGICVSALCSLVGVGLPESTETPARRFEFARALMGTEFRIIVFGVDSVTVSDAAMSAFSRIEELNRVMSDYLPDSELNRLSDGAGSGESVEVSEDLWTVLRFAQRLAEESDGAFDVTVGPLTRLWRRAIRRVEVPDSTEILTALDLVGYSLLVLDSTSTEHARMVQLERAGMRLDLGGIAKGYAVDRAFDILVAAGFSQILVDGGGDMRLGESPPARDGWTITIAGLDEDDERSARLRHLSNTALAQSGATYRFVERDGVRYSHIIDPRTGYGMTDGRIATVAAPTCMEADALASALSVASGPEKRRVLEAHPNATVEVAVEPPTPGTVRPH